MGICTRDWWWIRCLHNLRSDPVPKRVREVRPYNQNNNFRSGGWRRFLAGFCAIITVWARKNTRRKRSKHTRDLLEKTMRTIPINVICTGCGKDEQIIVQFDKTYEISKGILNNLPPNFETFDICKDCFKALPVSHVASS